MSHRFFLPLIVFLNACMPVTQTVPPTRATIADTTLPPVKRFSSVRPVQTAKSNADIARDFMDLTFQMESGRQLPILTRFEGPISLRVTGAAPPTLAPDLAQLLSRLRREAGIAISTTSSEKANITIEAVSRAQIRRVLPQAACFVAPNVASLSEYRSARRAPRTNWALLETRRQIAIFLPSDASPQEVRDCLHEELAQALGPLNDLYRLPDSVFNDDNVHTVLTSFDMLILRATYAPELRSGMSRAEVARRLPAVLARINPTGRGRGSIGTRPSPQAFNRAIQTALGPGAGLGARRNAANQAIRIATEQGWQDHRRAFAHFSLGRLLQPSNPQAAHAQFVAADRFLASAPSTRLHRAYVATQLASFEITQGRGAAALRLVDPYIATATQAQNAILLSTLLMLRAEALDLQGRTAEARAVRLDSLGWARYGFGPDWAVRAKLRDVATLNPQKASAT